MKFQDYYTINIKVNDTPFEIDPQGFSFSLSDSIYSLYPTAIFTIGDDLGVFQEYLGITNGNKVEIEYGNNNTTFKNKYIINEDTLQEPKDPGFLNGDVDVELIHEWYNEQQIRSKAYRDRISRIVRKIADLYNFKSIDINDTGNEDIWYQPNITDAKFINDILLKYAYSLNASNTPFYAFITNDNVFHFRNLQSMMEEDRVATIEYKIDSPRKKEEGEESSEKTFTQTVKRWSPNYKSLWKLKHKSVYRFNSETGKFENETLNITEFPGMLNLNIPISNDTGNITSVDYIGRVKQETGKKENNLGEEINLMRNGMLYDRFLIIQPFNPKLKSGKNVQLLVHARERNEQQISKRYSGDYIIENCEHIWSGDDSQGFTKIIVGRKYIQIPSAYSLKPLLMT